MNWATKAFQRNSCRPQRSKFHRASHPAPIRDSVDEVLVLLCVSVECENLNRIYGSKLAKYHAARSAVLYRINTEFAAKQQVDMERAKNDMEEHLLACPFATNAGRLMPLQESSALERFQ